VPRIELVDPVYYAPNDPIHWEYDNLPLRNIIRRQELINLALDNVIEQMRDAIGTAGSVANRLNQSLNPNGSLKTSAVDETLHSIEEHTDTDDYVRMTKAQSDKLDDIASEATDLEIYVDTDGSAVVKFSGGVLNIVGSSSVSPVITAPNILRFELAFPEEAAHQHYYGQTPVHQNLSSPNFINYKINSSSTPFVSGSLRVKINGLEIYEGVSVYVPGALVDDPWMLLNFDGDSTAGIFELSAAISEDDIIKIDYDISLI
jgi:hypothetical protein